MKSLESVEASRFMHEQGMKEIADKRFGTFINPIGALMIVHNVLVLPEPTELESISAAHTILTTRLVNPNALTMDEGGALKRAFDTFQRAFSAVHPPEEYEIRHNVEMWPRAMTLIQQPIDPSEMGQ